MTKEYINHNILLIKFIIAKTKLYIVQHIGKNLKTRRHREDNHRHSSYKWDMHVSR